ncbi:thioredoxin domain-containing protein [Haladaptatus sp. DYF46]|uniref:DsbA family protein n=1 Tax=Haladaptatus sp. DYF46 TaxID=2886041 RepID=UPI001E4D8E08|nr:thioredoxin domain-containing protein [Haladaptatus sp. DYF46]
MKTVSAAAVGLGVAGTASAAPSVSGAPVPDDTDLKYATMGTDVDNPTATVFGNFKCPYTQNFVNNNLKDVIDEYVSTGQLNIEFRALALQPPGTSSHGSSTYYISSSDPRISEVALSAWNEQPGEYWDFFEMMFDDRVSGTVTYGEMRNHLESAGVGDRSEIISNAKDGDYNNAIDQTADVAGSYGVSFTPTMELNGETTAPHHDTDSLLDWIGSQISGSSSSSASSSETTLTIDGTKTDGWTEYELSVDGTLEKSTAMDASKDWSDKLSGSTVNGKVGPWRDSYTISGEINHFTIGDGAVVYKNGETVDPQQLG